MTTAITPIPSLDRTSPTFKADLEAMFSTRFPNLTVELVAYLAALQTIASGGGLSLPYQIDLTTQADSDPGVGKLRFSNATQSSAAFLYIDDQGQGGKTYSGLIDYMGQSTSSPKGKLRITKVNDPLTFITFDVLGVVAGSGYRKINVTGSWGVSNNPFLNTDLVNITFDKTGNQGSVGPAGSLIRRATVLPNNVAAVTPDPATTDMVILSGLQQVTTINAPVPSGSGPSEGQSLLFRIKDSGTSRTLAWNSAYRAGSDLAIPTSTVAGKDMYLGFIYNAVALKWDFVSAINNF